MTPDTGPRLTDERHCWPCTVANTVVGVIVAFVPVVAALVRGDVTLLVITLAWACGILLYTFYRLLTLGYLPYAETIARQTGLHDRIGPDDERD